MHGHLTTKGPCTHWDTCGCRAFRNDPDTPEAVAKRVRELLEAVAACGHSIAEVTSERGAA